MLWKAFLDPCLRRRSRRSCRLSRRRDFLSGVLCLISSYFVLCRTFLALKEGKPETPRAVVLRIFACFGAL